MGMGETSAGTCGESRIMGDVGIKVGEAGRTGTVTETGGPRANGALNAQGERDSGVGPRV